MNPTYYVIVAEGNEGQRPTPRVVDLKEAVRCAKELARDGRVNVYKLIQTHTFAPTICNHCQSQTIEEKYLGGELPL